MNTFPLTLTHLRFTCQVETPLHLDVKGFRAGGALRGALGNVMRRATCTCTPSPTPPLQGRGKGEGSCPVCWLLAARERPGEERRGYALVPPLSLTPTPTGTFRLSQGERGISPGECFDFHITLFGETFRYLPYFLLAAAEIGREGVGYGRGKFALRHVEAVHPLAEAEQSVLAEGESLVHVPTLRVTHEDVLGECERLAEGLVESRGALRVQFLTPMRIGLSDEVRERQLLKVPHFDVIFARMLKQLDDLALQFAGGARRPLDEVRALEGLARQVRLAESQVRWVDVESHSSRDDMRKQSGGFVGTATYHAAPDVWFPLLPWLIWGQSTQIGKYVVKGNGLYQIES